MKRLRNICIAAHVSLMLTGCGLYNKYESNVTTPVDAFGTSQDVRDAMGETSIAQMSWREFFTDPLLQNLIEQALENNTDLNTTRLHCSSYKHLYLRSILSLLFVRLETWRSEI